MKPFSDSIAFGESPHADYRFEPLADGAAQAFKMFRRIMEHEPDHFFKFPDVLFALFFLLLLNI